VATCREIVNGALRKLGKLGAGREARTADATDALESLRGLYSQLINSGAFGRLNDVTPTANYTARENDRIFRNSEDVTQIDLPELVDDVLPSGWVPQYGTRWIPPSQSVSAQRPPRDCAVVVISDAISGETQEYLYDGTQRKWVGLFDLDLDDLAPLSHRDQDGLKSLLASRFSDEFGGEVSPSTSLAARQFRSDLVHRWSMPRQPQYGVYC
jgi:hypothetical protein